MLKLPIRQCMLAFGAVLLVAGSAAAESPSPSASPGAGKRLTGGAYKECKKHEANISALMQRIAKRDEQQLSAVTKVANNADNYASKQGRLSYLGGSPIASASQFIAQKKQAEDAVAALKSSSRAFRCDNPDPKGTIKKFKENQKKAADAIKGCSHAAATKVKGANR